MRASTNPRLPLLTSSWAYRWSIHESGVSPGMDTDELSQHQSSHQNAAPCCSNCCCRLKLDSACGIWLQSQTLHGPLKQFAGPSVPPATLSAAGSRGSLSEMLEWMFSVTWMPCCFAQSRNACGSGNSAGFHSQPSQELGDFQSVSTDRVSSGTWWARKAGISVFS